MNKPLGTLPKAPLVYVLGQVMFSKLTGFDRLMDQFYQLISNDYPDKEKEKHSTYFGDQIAKSTRYQLLTQDKHRGIIVTENSFVYHTTVYKNHEAYLGEYKVLLEKFSSLFPSEVECTRIGIRYVDVLFPVPDLSVHAQIKKGFKTYSLDESLNCKTNHTEKQSFYDTPVGGRLVLRYRESTGEYILPGDIFPNELAPAELLIENKEDIDLVGLLDIDHYIKEFNEPFDLDKIIKHFYQLREVSSNVFKEVTEEKAFAYWSNEGV